jgi:hypothetical protein
MVATDVTVDTFAEHAAKGNVLLDIWGPQCAPCLALMPAVEALGERYEGNVKLLKLNAPENRKVCRDLRVAGLPAYVTLRDGVEVDDSRATARPSMTSRRPSAACWPALRREACRSPHGSEEVKRHGASREEGDRARRA